MMKLSISTKKVIFFVLTLFLLPIESLEYINEALGVMNDALRVVAALIVLICFFLRKRWKLSPITFLLLVMMGELLVATILNGGRFQAWFAAAGAIISFGMLFEMTLAKSDAYVNTMMLLMELLSYIHLLLVLLFPNGLYVYNGFHEFWLFGQKNLALPYLLIAYVTAFYYGCSGGNRFREVGVYLSGIIASVLVRSSTSTVGLILLAVLFFIVRRGVKFNVYILFGVNLALFLGLVVFRIQIPLINYFIENVLHRTATFTGRDVIWSNALYYIAKQPILGHGLGNDPKRFGSFGAWELYAHNQILQELFDGGAIQLLLYLVLIFIIIRRLNKHKDGLFVQCLIVTMFALNVMFITESYTSKIIYLVYYYAYYAPDMESILLKRRNAIRESETPRSKLQN